MDISVQELTEYNDLVKRGLATAILCPFNESEEFPDIVITQVDKDDKVCFRCASCNTIFYPGINLIEKIKGYIKMNHLFLEQKS
jgi:hypothetical protein